MTSGFFSPLISRLRKKSYAREERLLESDMDLTLLVMNEEDDNGFSQRGQTSETNNGRTYKVNSLQNNCTADRFESFPQNSVESAMTENNMATRVVNPASRTKMVAFLGIVFALLSSVVFSVAALMVKLAKSVPSLEIVFMRLTLQLVFSLPPMIFLKDQFIHPWKKTKILLLRGVTGVTAMSLMMYSLKHMPLADARVIFYTSPVYTALLGRIFLKESVSKFDVIATLLSLGGVVLIGRPTFLFGSLGKSSTSGKIWIPTILAVLAAIFTACSIVLVRKISQDVGVRVVVFYFSLIGSVLSLVASLISGGFKYPDCGTHDTVYIIANGVLGYAGQLLTTKALEMEKAHIVSLVRTVGIALSFILQLMFLDVVPTGLSIGGAILVLLCNVVIFIKKYFDQKNLNDRPQDQSL